MLFTRISEPIFFSERIPREKLYLRTVGHRVLQLKTDGFYCKVMSDQSILRRKAFVLQYSKLSKGFIFTLNYCSM